MAGYEDVVRGPLKLKRISDCETELKKKKKKRKTDESTMAAAMQQMQHREQTEQQLNAEPTESTRLSQDFDSPDGKKVKIQKTKAQLAFEKKQEKRQMQKILEKASKTHKQRVEDFNRHLDSLSEHYDIPKVSWTK